MIERQTVKGQEASIIYLDMDFHPVNKDDAEIAKVVYDNGNTEILIFTEPPKKPTKDAIVTRYFSRHFWDAFKEEEHKRDKSGQFTGIGSEIPGYREHIEGGHVLAVKHGFKPLRGPPDADMGHEVEAAPGTEKAGPFTIYEKEENGKRHLLRFYTKHDWTEDPVPLWYVHNGEKTVGEGFHHEGLQEYLEKNYKTTDAFKEEQHPRVKLGPEAGEFLPIGAMSGSTSEKGRLFKVTKTTQHLVYAPNRDTWPAHIKALAIPPAWTQVHISMDPNAPLQAIGRDDKDRRQPKYLPKYRDSQDAKKFAKTKAQLKKYDLLIEKNDKNMKSKDPKIQEHAQIAALIFEMALRPGSEKDTGAEEQAYGATTLRAEHVVPNDKGLVDLVFTGKKGVHLVLPVENEQLAADLEDRALKGGQLFPNVSERSLLRYNKSIGGAEFTTKSIRTLVATRTGNDLVNEMPVPKTTAEYIKQVNRIGDIVSKKLGNTRAVCLASYIAPFVFAPWAHMAPQPKAATPRKKAA